jgi:hypothetical protein
MQIPVSATQAMELHPDCAQRILDGLNGKLHKAGKPTVEGLEIDWVYDASTAIARDTTSNVVVLYLRGKLGRRVVDACVGQFEMDSLPGPVAQHLARFPLPAFYPDHVATLHTKGQMALHRHLVYAGFVHRHTVHLVCGSVYAPNTLSLWTLTAQGARQLARVDAGFKEGLMAVEPGHHWAWTGRLTTAQVTRLGDAGIRQALGDATHPLLGFFE